MADISTGRQRGIVPFVDETTGRLPDQYLPQGVIDLQGDLEQAVSDASQSATAAKASETAAKASADGAASSASAAKASETAASSSATAAAESKDAAKASETAAARSAQAATEQVSSIGDSVERAAASANAAQQSASQAQSNATAANSSAQAAAASAESAQTATESAASSKDDAARSASAASESAQAAEASKTNAAASASAAETSKTNAAASASAAKVSETNAAASATAAQQAVAGLQTTVKEQGSKINQNTNIISQVSQKANSLEKDINSFKTTVSETYTTKDEFNALEIGGTNLIKNSDFSRQGEEWAFVDGVEAEYGTDVTMGTYVKALSSSSVNRRFYQFVKDVWHKGETLVYSFYAKSDDETPPVIDLSRSFIDYGPKHTLSNTWTRYTGSIASTDTPDGGGTLSIRFASVGTQTALITKIKLERGTRATDWSPAPEDFDGKYTSKTEFKQTLSNYVPLSTYQALEARVQALEAKLANK